MPRREAERQVVVLVLGRQPLLAPPLEVAAHHLLLMPPHHPPERYVLVTVDVVRPQVDELEPAHVEPLAVEPLLALRVFDPVLLRRLGRLGRRDRRLQAEHHAPVHLEVLHLIDEVLALRVGRGVRVGRLPQVVQGLQHDRVRQQAGAHLE
eukprot:scaffold57613_cov37-Phaeocystis_antarctica.AAC.1